MSTPLLQLPEILQSQAGKDITHNEALRVLEVFAGGRVHSRSVSDAQPLSPGNSDAWIVTRATFAIVGADTGNEVLRIAGDETARFAIGDTLEVVGSTGNDGTYTVSALNYDSGNDETDITAHENVGDATADGDILHAGGAFNGHGDEVGIWIGGAYLFVPPFEGAGPLWVNDEDVEVRFKGSAWGLVSSTVGVEDDGSGVLADTSGIDFGAGLDVTDNGDGTVTVTASAAASPTDFPVLIVTGDYTVQTANAGKIIAVTDTTSARTILLPAAGTAGDSFTIGVYIDDATNPVTVDADGSELIDDAETLDLVTGGDSVLLACDGAKWRTVASEITPSGAGTGDVTGPSASTDNAVPRFDGTNGETIQGSGVVIDDNDNISGHGQKVVARSADFTIAASDAGVNNECASGSAFNVTIPTNANVPLPVGFTTNGVQADANAVSFAVQSGVTLRSRGGVTSTAGQWAGWTLYKRATDEWVLLGDLA